MARYAFDIETNGLLDTLDRIHCIALTDLDRPVEMVELYHGEDITIALGMLEIADEVVGQNIIDFDIPAIQKVYPGWAPQGKVTDTLIISRLVYPHLKNRDFERKPPTLPQRLYGSHGLEAWGHRLGKHKGDYAAEMKAAGLDPWAAYNERMGAYCELDVEVTSLLYRTLMRSGWSQRSIDLEHEVHYICNRQMAHGCSFDEKAAMSLYAELAARRHEIETRLREVFGNWWVTEPYTPKVSNRKVGYVKGAPMTKITLIEFNPASRDHIAKRLKDLRGWSPSKFTPSGKPEVDESTLEGLPYPEVPLLLEYLMLQKRIGQIAEGKEAWLKLVKEDGRIYGRIKPNAAITGRATHHKPNLAQVPAVRSPYGKECRGFFRATPGKVMVGADASGLELRLFAHYLSHYDNGEYARTVLEGDIHTANQQAAGLPTRDDAKTFIYALLYGAGDGKLGTIIGRGPRAGRGLRARFMDAIPAYASLVKGVKAAAKKKRRIRALDGRYLWVRSEHAALNTLLQGAGAIIMKQAMVNYHRILEEKGIPFDQVFWVHDEFQVECAAEYADAVGEAMVEGIRMTTQQFNLGCPLDGEYKVGSTWAETH